MDIYDTEDQPDIPKKRDLNLGTRVLVYTNWK